MKLRKTLQSSLYQNMQLSKHIFQLKNGVTNTTHLRKCYSKRNLENNNAPFQVSKKQWCDVTLPPLTLCYRITLKDD